MDSRLPRWLPAVAGLFALSSVASLAAVPKHPAVSGVERVLNGEDAKAAAGRILLAELNCVSCHKAEDATQLKPKQAPILDEVGSRVQVEWLQGYLTSTHAAKAGTTMPDLFAGLSEADRAAKVTALTHFLASTGVVAQSRADGGAVGRGDQLYHEIGCFACHGSRKDAAGNPAAIIPLGNVEKKYTIPSLTAFLKDPLDVRPGGRMPSFNLNDQQARDLACYFLKDLKLPATVKYEYFEVSWNDFGDFGQLKPKSVGESEDFGVEVRQRNDQFALRFTAFVHIPKDGRYRFHLGSDDGSRMSVSGKEVVNVGGVHPHQTKTGEIELKTGAHQVVVEYFEAGGEESLKVEIEGPGVARQPLAGLCSPEKEKVKLKDDGQPEFVLDDALAKDGRVLFASIGCASCHQMKSGQETIQSNLVAKSLAAISAGQGGCLAKVTIKGLPDYHLSDVQRGQIQAALKSGFAGERDSSQTIHESMAQFNCFACHERGKIGGAEPALNALFKTAMPEMGDEGRIPPALDGVGDKLTEAWFKNILENGAKDRGYMMSVMPKFGGGNVGHLLTSFRKVDLKTEAEITKSSAPLAHQKAAGRRLVGEKGMGCIKCHPFGGSKATGIQAMDLQIMSKRLRQDWWYRYMARPGDFRPGTRMPAPWPFGNASVRDVLDGNVGLQMNAVWTYLEDGDKAGIPLGLQSGAIILAADKEPIIYRNFFEGVSPRGIAVGYPELVNLCFDAEQCALALVWHNDFMDASMHWNGRGQGNQRPLGDNILSLVRGVPIASLANVETPWPTDSAASLGYRFRGYRFDKQRRPVFRYDTKLIEVSDEMKPATIRKVPGFERTLTIVQKDQNEDAPKLWYRAAEGSSIKQLDGEWFQVDERFFIQVQSDGQPGPIVRPIGNRQELVIGVDLLDGKTKIVQRYAW
ncbi:MAG: c-type cytochrome [Planctomycetota bacterium]|nr:c-type cytochrome [Planctomycetota bacterium]MDA1249538.1 c-type cytochrome [Planctomycetota bacterium]